MKFYPLADRHPKQLHKSFHSIGLLGDKTIKAIYSGEKRKPKKGEWYLSGAPVEAYQARGDLDTIYHIAKIVRIKEVITTTIEERLEN